MMTVEEFAKIYWNKIADQFNQWDSLGCDEKAELINAAKMLVAQAEKDAERYRWLRNESWAGYNAHKHKPEVFETVTMVRGAAGNFKTILAEEALDEAVDAAIAQQKESEG